MVVSDNGRPMVQNHGRPATLWMSSIIQTLVPPQKSAIVGPKVLPARAQGDVSWALQATNVRVPFFFSPPVASTIIH